jgi:hypothetical protein
VFFSDSDRPHWWSPLFRPGFRHIRAAAWYESAQRWVYFDPCGRGTHIEVATDAEFGARFEHLIRTSAAILRVRSEFARGGTPAAAFCVGQVKALLGVKSRALSPFGLYRHLVAHGAEVVERPREDAIVVSQPERACAAGPAGGPRAQAHA